MSQNLLSRETSPYLLQHRDNPVHWRPWGSAALEEAKTSDKPVLLSVGYSACHWCHVMAHESFENDETAAVMNELFINIKVDREERPDVDTLYQSALAIMGQQGGWPLTMFLTSEGRPFWGGTYFPPSPRYGRPGFADVLRAVATAYRNEPDKIRKNVTALADALQQLAHPPAGNGLTVATLDRVASLAMRLVDPLRGGTAGAPKFPQPTFFQFLWRSFLRTRADILGDAVAVSVRAMCQGGIYDHVGGGFARYSTDEDWLVPHFEKMLYDNALLVDLLAELHRTRPDPLWHRRAAESIAWAMRDLRVDVPGGGFAFASALDADSEGIEGKYYVWTDEELRSLLGAHADLFADAYDVTPGGNWEGVCVLNRRANPTPRPDAEEDILRDCLEVLLQRRASRVPPQRDDKVLSDWNGLMITALVHAGVVFDEPAWVEAAEQVFAAISRVMDTNGRLGHTWCAGAARHPGVLDDYANMINAALTLFECTARHGYLDAAETWAQTVHRHYWDDADGGYFLSADDTGDVISRTKTIADYATPSGNSAMLSALARLQALTGNPVYGERADVMVRLFSGDNEQYLLGVPGLLNAFERLVRGTQVVIIGGKDDAATAALRHAAMAGPDPLATVATYPPEATLPEGHPAHGKSMIDGQATAYVCREQTCGAPVTKPAALRGQLQRT